MTTDTATVLDDLITTLEDGRLGFEQAADHLRDEEGGSIAERMLTFSAQRADFSSELRALAAAHGITVKEAGSVAGTIHRGWIGLKDAVTGDSAGAVLGAAETGEDHAVAEFEDALAADLPAEIRNVIARQAQEVKRAHDEVRNLRDRFQAVS